jgi:SHS2 domain-containing protein
MSYELRDHTADVAVEATGPTLESVFAAAGDGMAAAMCEDVPEASGDRFDFEVRAESREALLFDYLDELIYERDVRTVLPVDNEVAVREADGDGGEWVAEGSARGVPLAEISAREIKAVTYSEMVLEERDEGWRAYVVLDV